MTNGTYAPSAPIAFSSVDIDERDIGAVVGVLRSGWLTTGSVSAELERALAEFLGMRHVVCTSSCTASLQCALSALNLPPGSAVAVPAWTFVSTVNSVLHLGHLPVLLDVDAATMNASARSLSAALDKGVKAVVLVHFAGNPVSELLTDMAYAAGVPVVEDCAHAFGTQFPTSPATIARCFSFYATKNLTCGEGGALATNDDEVASRARAYRLHGMSHDAWRRYRPGGPATYDVSTPGIKGNLPDVLAALALSQLERFPTLQARRSQLITAYRAHLSHLPGLEFVPQRLDPSGSNHLAVVLLAPRINRSRVMEVLSAQGIGTSVHFTPVHHFTGIGPLVEVADTLATCDDLAPRVLSLPLHTLMAESDVERVATSLAQALRTDPS